MKSTPSCPGGWHHLLSLSHFPSQPLLTQYVQQSTQHIIVNEPLMFILHLHFCILTVLCFIHCYFCNTFVPVQLMVVPILQLHVRDSRKTSWLVNPFLLRSWIQSWQPLASIIYWPSKLKCPCDSGTAAHPHLSWWGWCQIVSWHHCACVCRLWKHYTL